MLSPLTTSTSLGWENAMNRFIALTNAFVQNGEDMEDVARELAEAFKTVVDEGAGEGKDIQEYTRLRPQG